MAHAQVRPRGEGSAGDDGVTRVATAESAGLATHDRDTALSGTVVRRLSAEREEPAWMLRFRLRALDALEASSEPGASRLRSAIDAEDVVSVRVGVRPRPASPRGYSFADAVAESERAYCLVRDELESLGVLFMGMDEAVREHSGTLQELLGSVVPPEDDPSAALNGAVWSGGTFLYVPPGVRVQVPLQPEIRADFRKTEPFERSLLVAGPGGALRPSSASLTSGNDDLDYTYDLEIGPGETNIVMHFASQNPNRAAAIAKGPQLEALELGALDGMSDGERAASKRRWRGRSHND